MKKFSRIIALILCAMMLLGMLPSGVFAAENDAAAEPVVLNAEEIDPNVPIFENTQYSFAERAADLVGRMTLAQKAGQMINNTSAIAASQLSGGALNVPATKGIGRYTWWSETLHGCGGGVNYPQNTTAASTWNLDLYRQEATNIGQEIRERNNSNLNFYSPTINLHRDPRWGRNEESYSEDVLLTSAFGTQWVLGMEGRNEDGTMVDPDGYYNLHTTIKHYVANNNEGKSSGDTTGRLRSGAKSSLRMLREYYALPYGEIIRDANVSSVMTAYSYFNEDPSSYSSYLMDTLLRQIYGFKGHITSDCDSVASMQNLHYTNRHTGKEITMIEALSGALAHGEDLECNGGHSSNGSGTSGFHTDYNAQINAMINAASETDKGIFTENSVDISVHRLMTARIQTGELDGDIKIKQDAAARSANSTALRNQRRALVEAINAEGVVMLQNKGVLPLDLSENGVKSVVIVGAWQTDGYTGLYSQASRNELNIQRGITDAINAKKSGVTFTNITSNSLTDANKQAIAAADVAIVVTGTPQSYSREDGDRASIILPNNLESLISTVGQLNPNTIAIMETCGPMRVKTFQNDVNAILWSSYGGQWKTGFGAIIAGVNPSGKVTDTWYQEVNDSGASDVPPVTDYDMLPSEGKNGRTYMYYNGANAPSYPFGYGLSYTTFAYSDLKIDKAAYDANETVNVSFKVTNTGDVTGKEVAQLYIAQPDAPAELKRPIRRLEGFDKIELQPGESKTLSMQVKIEDLAFFNEEADCFQVDTGKYQVQVGTNSAAANLTADFTVSGALTELPAVLTIKANQEGDTAKGIEERLIFDKNKVVNPQVTVSMNTEKLYGYIIANQLSPIKQMKSCPLPEGMVLSYSSNRPNVVKVEGDQVKTVGPGVATLTITATYNGATVSGDAVIYVTGAASLDGITVDGEPLEKFSSKKFNYSMKLENKSHIPVVAAQYSDPDLDVVVNQATELPGAATVVATDRNSKVVSTYVINFKVPASGGGKSTLIDFTNPADASKFEILNDTGIAIAEGQGLTLTATRPAFEDCNGQNSGDQATVPENVVMIPAAGDWTATLEFDFSTGSAANGYYQFFGFYAAEGDDYQNLAGIRGGDGAMQNFLRVDGAITADSQDINSTPGLASNGTYFYQLIKDGDTYTCLRSADGEEFTEMFVYEATGVEADRFFIDAYTGMTEGYQFTLKSLNIEAVGGGLPNIDFTNPADASKFDVVNETSAAITEGTGLTLTATRPAFEDCNGQNTGDQATTPEDAIVVPVAGDWTATLEFDFSTVSAANGYYQFFGFYAAEGDDFQNLAGIRGGDGAMQNFLRVDGAITADSEDINSTPGLASNGTYFYQLIKDGDTYTCLRSEDGEEFTEMFAYEATGIEADSIVIDAYTGMTEGYQFTLKSLTFEGGGTPPVVKEKPEVAAIFVNGEAISFDPAVTTYNFEVARDSTKVSMITATAGNESTKIDILQVEGVTGTSYVIASVGEKSITYALSFNYGPQNDYFADGDFDADLWTVLNKDETAFRVDAGKGLVLPTQQNDIYQDGVNWKNCFVMPAMGNWEVVAKVVYPVRPNADYQQGMFLVWQDENNYLRMNCQNTDTDLVIEPGLEVDGEFTAASTTAVAAADDNSVTLYFRITRTGNAYTASYSSNGTEYTNVYEANVPFADPKLGLFATMNGEGAPVDVNFEYVYVVAREGLQPEYVEMLSWAAQNAADTIAAAIPAEASEAIAIPEAPHGYVLSVESSDPDVIAADGTVKPAEEDTDVTLTFTVAEGATIASATATVKVPGSGPMVNPFEDIAPNAFYFDAVLWAVKNDITNGVTPTRFAPDRSVTRGQIVTFLWRAAGCPEPEAEATFADLKAGAFYTKAVAWAVENGITDGVSKDRFAPDSVCTRAQIVTFLWRYKGKPAASAPAAFTDLVSGAFYVDAVAWAVEAGVANGMSKELFKPSNSCTRGQAVTFIQRAVAK